MSPFISKSYQPWAKSRCDKSPALEKLRIYVLTVSELPTAQGYPLLPHAAARPTSSSAWVVPLGCNLGCGASALQPPGAADDGEQPVNYASSTQSPQN